MDTTTIKLKLPHLLSDALPPKLQGKLRGGRLESVLLTLRAHCEAVSRDAPLAHDLLTLGILMALNGEAEWEPLEICARWRQQAPGNGAYQMALRQVFIVGREAALGEGKGAGDDEQNMVSAAFSSISPQPVRPKRLSGDSEILQAAANQLGVSCSLIWGANNVHGLPSQLQKQCVAEGLRATYAILTDLYSQAGGSAASSPPPPGETGAHGSLSAADRRAFWWTMYSGANRKLLANGLRLAIMDVSVFKKGPVKHTAAISTALQHPLFLAIVKKYRDVLLSDSPTWLKDTVPRDERALLRTEKAFNAAPQGSWSRFAAFISLHPRRAIHLRWVMLAQREEWIEELRALEERHGVRLGDCGLPSTAADTLENLPEYDPVLERDVEEELLDGGLQPQPEELDVEEMEAEVLDNDGDSAVEEQQLASAQAAAEAAA